MPGQLLKKRSFQILPSVDSTSMAYALLAAMLALTVLIYWPGLSGGFLFDDFPNLEQIGARGPIASLELLRAYLASGSAGPTGRPLSLLSFLIDARDWPADPWPFKRTNLVIHLAVGLMLFATTRRLLTTMGRAPRESAWVGALAAGLWLINPFLVSTTLYAVQRMTQLAALFVIAGIWCYLRGRDLLASRPRLGYAVISIGVPVCTLLATLCKENGALLPLLVGVIHLSLKGSPKSRAPARSWVAVFLALPSALIAGYLLTRVVGADRAFASRDFTLYERLLSEPRVLWDYLYHLAIPHIQTQGLFQDGRAISRSLLQPWTTLPALLGLIGLVAVAFMARLRSPLFALAVFFFLAAHLLESTTVPLELYFEHRNYLPAAFLFLPLAAAAHDAVSTRAGSRLVVALVAVLAGSYAVATWQRASLWGDTDRLLLVWADTNPDSDRAQVSAAQIWLRQDRPDKAMALLEAAGARMPDSALITVNILAFRASLGVLSVADLEAAAPRLRAGRFDAQGLQALELLVEVLNQRAPVPDQARVVGELLQGIQADSAENARLVYDKATYLQGLLLAGQGQVDAAMPYLRRAFELYNSPDTGLRLVGDLANLGYFEPALELLARSEALLESQGAANEPFSAERYRSEIERLRGMLLADIAARPAGLDPVSPVPGIGPE